MPIRIQVDLEDRSTVLQRIAADIVRIADSEDEAGSMAYNLEDTVRDHTGLVEDYNELLKHAMTEEFKELMNLNPQDFQLGDVYVLEDVKAAKKEVRKAVTNEVRAALDAE